MTLRWEENLNFCTQKIYFLLWFWKLDLYSKLFPEPQSPCKTHSPPPSLNLNHRHCAISHSVHNPHPNTQTLYKTNNAYLPYAYTMRHIQKYVAPRVLASTFVPIIHAKTCLQNCTSLHCECTRTYTPNHMGGPPHLQRKCSTPVLLLVTVRANEKGNPTRSGPPVFLYYLNFTEYLTQCKCTCLTFLCFFLPRLSMPKGNIFLFILTAI